MLSVSYEVVIKIIPFVTVLTKKKCKKANSVLEI